MIIFKKKLINDIIRYVFFLSLFFWVLLTIYISYQYIQFSSTHVSTKGGTFVEGIFGGTSYLPYLRNDTQSTFYQGLLFNACLRLSYQENTSPGYVPDLCNVTTKDNKTYNVSLRKGFIRSDGTPVSIEDVYFTYAEIIRNNKRKLSNLIQYNTLIVEKDINNTLKVIFPSASADNMLFFTNYILPKHILVNAELNDYKSIFALTPVYTNCANLVSQSKDEYSLIFNLVNCPQTHLNYYQVKNTLTFDAFQKTIEENGKSIIDAYIGDVTLPGYQAKKIITNKLITVFFNTRSDTLRVRGRRVLGGLIKHNFYITGYDQYLQKNTNGLFDVFQSTGAGVKDLLNREYKDNLVTKEDLIEMNIKPLPSSLFLKGEHQKLVYFIDTGVSLPVELVFDKPYDNIVISYQNKTYTPKHFVKGGKTGWFVFGTKEKNLGTGLNKYTIYGYDKAKKTLIASIDIYNVFSESQETYSQIPVKLKVIYYENDLTTFVVNRLKDIFSGADIINNFIFEKVTTPEQLQGRLIAGDYDLIISTVDMGLKQDVTKLFSTDKSDINPSQYQNQKLTNLLKQYEHADEPGKKKILVEINTIYSKDMPFVILGHEYLTINFKSSIIEKLRGTGDIMGINEYNWRQYIYNNLKLVSNIHIDGKKVWNFTNFSNFLTDAIKK